MAADRLLVFAKMPEAGRVKTRLTPPLPPDEAAAVYEACLRDVVTLAARERAQVEIWYHPSPLAQSYFAREFEAGRAVQQADGDMGAKMRDAFERSFQDGALRVLIVGSDVPTMPEPILNFAVDGLQSADMVVGPSRDGGYYMIGIAAHAWAAAQSVFEDIAWSTEHVFRATALRAQQAGLQVRVLPGWYDVDTIDDLRQALCDADVGSHIAQWAARPEAIHFLNAG